MWLSVMGSAECILALATLSLPWTGSLVRTGSRHHFVTRITMLSTGSWAAASGAICGTSASGNTVSQCPLVITSRLRILRPEETASQGALPGLQGHF